MFHIIEKFVDFPNIISCQWDSEDPRYNEVYLRHDMEDQLELGHCNYQRPIWLMESTNTETGEIGASFHRDNPSAAFGWSENVMELIRRFAAQCAANNTTENDNEGGNTMDTHEEAVTVNVTPETVTTEPTETTETVVPERCQIGVCSHCGEPIYEGDDYDEDVNGQWVCNACLTEYDNCGICDRLVCPDDTTFIHHSRHYSDTGEYICPGCLETALNNGDIGECDCCGEYYIDGLLNRDDNGNVICDPCFDDDYTRCYDCNDIIRRDDAYYSNEDGEYYCEYCWERNGHNNEPKYGTLYEYHHYSERPSVFYGEKVYDENGNNITEYLGVELETDGSGNRGEYVDDLCRAFPNEQYFVCSKDGSLNNGVELVMKPATLDYHLNEFPWERITEIARDNDFKSHDAGNCGLHVHVSRAALGGTESEQDYTAAKITILFDRHWDKIVKFSRRTYLQYCNKLNADIKEYDSREDAIYKAKSRASGHYRALNLDNEATVEFRVFRGTLCVNTIKATLEFVDNMVAFAKSHNLREVMGADFADYALYKRYPELDTYLRQRSLMPANIDNPVDDSAEE